jgi:hypothetical protein
LPPAGYRPALVRVNEAIIAADIEIQLMNGEPDGRSTEAKEKQVTCR